MISLLLMFAIQDAPANDPQPDDIVVVANREACRVRFADKDMTDAAFNARAAEWRAGKPVRVIARAEADFPCIRKIATRLVDRGVTRIEFVDPQGRPALPFELDPNLPRYTMGIPTITSSTRGTDGDDSPSDHKSVSRAAAELIRLGRCDEAREMALAHGDLDAAADVVAVCRARAK